MVKIEGGRVKVGDTVGFKADVEQYGKIVKIIEPNFSPTRFVLESFDGSGFEGGYIGGETRTVVDADRCWID